jgi:4-amino-4-deoxy-L-arabinose transferase-like glycosyltransferase
MTQNQKTILYDTLILLFLVGLFFLLYLGTRALNVPDEGRYPNVAREMLMAHQWITPKVNGVPFLDKPILYYWFEALGMKILGINTWGIRIFPAIFGILGCLLTYFAGLKLFDRKTGLLAAAILATSPLYFGAAHYANMDLELALWVSSSLIFFLFAKQNSEQKKSTRLWMSLAFICAACAFLTKGLMGLVFPIYIIGAWVLLCWRWSIIKHMHLFFGLILFSAMTLPWIILVQHQNPWFLHYFFVYQQFDRYTETGFNNVMPFWFYLPIILIGTMPWSFLSLPGLKHLKSFWHKRYTVEAFLGLWVVLIFVFFSIPDSKIVGYILPIFVPLALLCSRSILLSLSKFGSKRASFFLVKLWIVMGVIFCFTLLYFAPKFNHKSALPLSKIAKPYITKNTLLISYHTYYEDLPIYLNQKLIVVYDWNNKSIQNTDNWARDFYDGLHHTKNPQKTYPWMIGTHKFDQLWAHSKKPIIIFTKKTNLSQIDKLNPKPKLLGEDKKSVVLLKNESFSSKPPRSNHVG